jgi:hypothetical protein
VSAAASRSPTDSVDLIRCVRIPTSFVAQGVRSRQCLIGTTRRAQRFSGLRVPVPGATWPLDGAAEPVPASGRSRRSRRCRDSTCRNCSCDGTLAVPPRQVDPWAAFGTGEVRAGYGQRNVSGFRQPQPEAPKVEPMWTVGHPPDRPARFLVSRRIMTRSREGVRVVACPQFTDPFARTARVGAAEHVRPGGALEVDVRTGRVCQNRVPQPPRAPGGPCRTASRSRGPGGRDGRRPWHRRRRRRPRRPPSAPGPAPSDHLGRPPPPRRTGRLRHRRLTWTPRWWCR